MFSTICWNTRSARRGDADCTETRCQDLFSPIAEPRAIFAQVQGSLQCESLTALHQHLLLLIAKSRIFTQCDAADKPSLFTYDTHSGGYPMPNVAIYDEKSDTEIKKEEHASHVLPADLQHGSAAFQKRPPWILTRDYTRDSRANSDSWRILSAELDMIRHSKLIKPLRNRRYKHPRQDPFVWGRRSHLSISCSWLE
ncbi:uncharacterized protein BYT42DRAFT_617050 [Radiomyces spectabilis]|uniref:uncharacterized protein n=1 Tax=Radiomyces spectabilis TaxID=64574 RepID=UPI00221FEB06|nr:uncharacterized protein BYT42DRAFT_617050 [Radiomyces spectabilis]KAI8370504.1 hypothetical protein BYT42DRAFT_617050 [Radiomyces spectabilis]